MSLEGWGQAVLRLSGAGSGASRRQHHRQISVSGDANEAVFLRVFRFNSFFRTVGGLTLGQCRPHYERSSLTKSWESLHVPSALWYIEWMEKTNFALKQVPTWLAALQQLKRSYLKTTHVSPCLVTSYYRR